MAKQKVLYSYHAPGSRYTLLNGLTKFIINKDRQSNGLVHFKMNLWKDLDTSNEMSQNREDEYCEEDSCVTVL